MNKVRHPIIDNDSPVTIAHNIIKFEPLPALHQNQSSVENAKLRAEIQALRLELARAQRQIAHYETLLQNAVTREHEIRSELVKRKT